METGNCCVGTGVGVGVMAGAVVCGAGAGAGAATGAGGAGVVADVTVRFKLIIPPEVKAVVPARIPDTYNWTVSPLTPPSMAGVLGSSAGIMRNVGL